MTRPRCRHRRGFSLIEVSISSGLLVFLSLLLATTWTGLGRPLLQTMYRSRIAEESHMALACLARDLGGCQPGSDGVVGAKTDRALVGRTQPGGAELWLCFDGGATPNGTADWLAPDVVITYAVVDGALVRTDQSTGSEYVVANNVESMALTDLGGELEIVLTMTCRGTTQTYTLIAKNP